MRIKYELNLSRSAFSWIFPAFLYFILCLYFFLYYPTLSSPQKKGYPECPSCFESWPGYLFIVVSGQVSFIFCARLCVCPKIFLSFSPFDQEKGGGGPPGGAWHVWHVWPSDLYLCAGHMFACICVCIHLSDFFLLIFMLAYFFFFLTSMCPTNKVLPYLLLFLQRCFNGSYFINFIYYLCES